MKESNLKTKEETVEILRSVIFMMGYQLNKMEDYFDNLPVDVDEILGDTSIPAELNLIKPELVSSAVYMFIELMEELNEAQYPEETQQEQV